MRKMYYALLLATAIPLMSGCTQKQAAPETAAATENMKDMEGAEDTAGLPDETSGLCTAQSGVVTAIDEKSGAISIKGMMEGSEKEEELVLNTDAKTAFYDIAADKKTELSMLKVGDEVHAMVSTAFTASLPPQTFAYAVFLNVGDQFIPEYAELTEARWVGEQVILTDSSRLSWIVSADTELRRLSDGGQLKEEELKKGARCLIWPSIEPVSEKMDAGIMTEKLVLIDN